MQTLRRADRWAFALLLLLAVWYALSFVGVSGLVGSWKVSDGLWFYLALALLIGLGCGLWSLARGESWGDWLLLFLLGGWAYIQYASHWHRFLFPPSKEAVQRYYSSFPYWYLFPRSARRVVPDGFHTLMHILIVVLFVVVAVRLIGRARRLAPVPATAVARSLGR